MTQRVRVLVFGDVQGVGYRWYCREQAMHRGLGGSVRNLPDGRVEAVFEGEIGAVESMIEWCRQGPSSANVERVEITEEPPAGEARFVIAR